MAAVDSRVLSKSGRTVQGKLRLDHRHLVLPSILIVTIATLKRKKNTLPFVPHPILYQHLTNPCTAMGSISWR
jgi:hypothetical protein